MSVILVEGGRKLSGAVTVQGAKNSVLPMLAATVLCPGVCCLRGCPALSDVDTAVQIIRSVDKTRTIDPASGWHDQGVSDVKSLHVYFKPYRFRPDKKGRAVVLSEFGGYNLPVAGHTWNTKNFGYKGYQTPEALGEAVKTLYETQIVPACKSGLAADVYTQLSDVEDEVNGFVTYDRRVEKLPEALMQAISQELKGD